MISQLEVLFENSGEISFGKKKSLSGLEGWTYIIWQFLLQTQTSIMYSKWSALDFSFVIILNFILFKYKCRNRDVNIELSSVVAQLLSF